MAHKKGEEQKSRNMVSPIGYCYSQNQTHLLNQLQRFESNPEIYNLTTDMEIIGFQPRNHQQQSGTMMVDTESSSWHDQNRLMVDDDHPSLISSSREGYFGKSMNFQYTQHVLIDGLLGKVSNIHNQEELFEIKNSKYLGPAQELLSEFCNLGTKQSDPPKIKTHETNQWENDQNASSSSFKKSSLCTLELLELQKRKSKLLSMLQEVDRRYKHYSDQMIGIVSSFEMVAGPGSATAYSSLASKAMSRHFRCLRDGIVGQIKATKTAMMRENHTVAPGTTRGETPRLRVVDQNLRFQQMRLMESHPWRPQRGLPERSASVLRAWLFEHFLHPYPSDVDKHILARLTGLSRSQVSNWFINARVRLWKPMVEEIYLEETKEQDNMASSDGITSVDHANVGPDAEDQKPKPDKLVRNDSECLSSIINNPEKNETQNSKIPQNQNLHRGHCQLVADAFGDVELDFSSYNFSGGGGGGGVSLTLGLQQHGESGVSLAFSPISHSSLLYKRDHMEDCQQVQYSLLDTTSEGQNLPYGCTIAS